MNRKVENDFDGNIKLILFCSVRIQHDLSATKTYLVHDIDNVLLFVNRCVCILRVADFRILIFSHHNRNNQEQHGQCDEYNQHTQNVAIDGQFRHIDLLCTFSIHKGFYFILEIHEHALFVTVDWWSIRRRILFHVPVRIFSTDFCVAFL